MANNRKVALACSICGSRNYTATENPNRTDRLEIKKYCKYCGKHTLHRETKQSWLTGGVRMKFFKSVAKTMKDTTWETGRELSRDTTTVVVMSLFFIAFFALVDYVVLWALQFVG